MSSATYSASLVLIVHALLSFVVNIKQMGGSLSGHSWKKVLFDEEVFDFDIRVQKGGISLLMKFDLTSQYINSKQRPVPHMTKSTVVFYSSLIDINIRSKQVGPNLLNASVKVFKGIFLSAFQQVMNTGTFTLTANSAISKVMIESQGEIKMGLLEMLLVMLPDNDISIPENVAISYAGQDGVLPIIGNGKI